LSRVAVIWPKNMLHDARIAGLAKLRRSIRSTDERQLRAVHVGRGEIVWQDRCDAANGSKEPVAEVPNSYCERTQHYFRRNIEKRHAAGQCEQQSLMRPAARSRLAITG
jgi:hypothetical protein